ncbi:MAG: hypothetical protein R3D65_06445 [Zhengella sp.]|uniref:hypothetical protein n=1 Tax=Zhengella sp. TaxID=2282762 RepID=UPI001E18C218|nr:hypothetical protein [Notoacmeibacter sp.]
MTLFGRITLGLIAASLLFAGSPARAQSLSILERLVLALDDGYGTTKWSMMANIAENSGGALTMQPRSLLPGDSVVIGYDLSGNPVSATSGAEGVLVTEVQASRLSAGLPAGLYPVGSALYSLPPGAQLTLQAEDREGQALQRARELLTARIDGSVANLIYYTIPDELVEVAALQHSFADPVSGLNIGEITSTVLGAVNTGQIVTEITTDRIVGPVGVILDLTKSQIANGPNIALSQAATETTHALHRVNTMLGGSAGTATVAVNIASNTMEIRGRITNVIMGKSAQIRMQAATAIGAVNGGIVGPAAGGP